MYADPQMELYLNFLRFVPASLCFLFNGMLLRMIFMSRHKDLGTYRYILLIFVLADILNGLIHLVVLPSSRNDTAVSTYPTLSLVNLTGERLCEMKRRRYRFSIPETYHNAFVMGAHSWWRSRTAIFCFVVVFILTFPVLSLNFLYRLVAVKHPFSLDSFKKPRVIALLLAITIANCSWACISRYIGFDSEYNKRYVNELFTGNVTFSTYLAYDIADIDNYLIMVFWDIDIYDGPHWMDINGCLYLVISGYLAYLFMTYASYNIIHQLRKTTILSAKSHHQHVQIFRAIALQALTPSVTSHLPIAGCAFLPMLGIELPLFAVITPLLCSFHPVLDALIMLATVSQFRHTLLDWVRCTDGRKNSRVIVHPAEGIERRKHTI